MSADFHTLLRSVGHSAHSIHPADLERSHALLERGADPVVALTKAAILNALEHQHLSLDEIEGIFGEDALNHVYGGTARDGLASAAEQGDAREGLGSEEGTDAGGEQLRRAGEDHEDDEADQSGQADGPTEHAGGAERDGTEAEGAAASAGDAATEGAAEGEGRLEGVAARLAAIAAELGAIAAGLAPQDEDEPADGSRSAPVIVESAEDIARAGERVDAEPSEAQKAAGNYQKAHVRFDGFDITIENPKGSIRSGLSSSGKSWQVEMPAAYGYIKRTTGADDDHVDVYLADHAKPGAAFIIDQVDPKTRAFDEHKIVLGAPARQAARAIYDGAFSDGSGPSRIGAMTQVTTDRLRTWLRDGDQTKPFAAR